MNILITDGENRSSLAATRSLGRKGHRVFVSGRSLRNISSVSRYCTKRYEVADPMMNETTYIRDIETILIENAIDIVLPMTEPTIRALLQHAEALPERTRVASPPWGVMERALDKMMLIKIAQQNKVPTPLSVFIQNRKDFFVQQPNSSNLPFDFPVVVKPYMSRIPTNRGYIQGGVMYASTPDELCSLYSRKECLDYPSIIQEKIVGPGTAIFALFDKDRPLALFSHRRLREKPPSGGVSVLSESIPLDDEMMEASIRLLTAIGWTGVAMVEFKRDERDGCAKLMEINGRLWGSLQLAIDCGVDFPSLLVDYIQGNKPEQTIVEYNVGHRLKWFLGTLDHLIIRLRNNNTRLNLQQNSPHWTAAIIDFLRIWERNTTFDVIDRDDIGPFIQEIREYLENLL